MRHQALLIGCPAHGLEVASDVRSLSRPPGRCDPDAFEGCHGPVASGRQIVRRAKRFVAASRPGDSTMPNHRVHSGLALESSASVGALDEYPAPDALSGWLQVHDNEHVLGGDTAVGMVPGGPRPAVPIWTARAIWTGGLTLATTVEVHPNRVYVTLYNKAPKRIDCWSVFALDDGYGVGYCPRSARWDASVARPQHDALGTRAQEEIHGLPVSRPEDILPNRAARLRPCFVISDQPHDMRVRAMQASSGKSARRGSKSSEVDHS